MTACAGVMQKTAVLPPDMNGYHYVRLLRSALTHDTFLARRDAVEGEAEDAHVVIRVYALEYLRRDEALRDRLERELLLARTLKPHAFLAHSSLPFASPSDLFTVQTYYDQGELYEALERQARGEAPEGPCQTGAGAAWERRVLRELMQALRYLHEDCRLAHRDVRLENIYIDRDGHVKLAGLGLAAVLPPADASAAPREEVSRRWGGAVTQYTAPELLADEKRPCDGAMVDVWAAGVVFFALLTRCFPFDTAEAAAGATAAELRERIIDGERCLSQHAAFGQLADPQAQDLLRNMLRVNAAVRLTAAEVLQHPYLRHGE